MILLKKFSHIVVVHAVKMQYYSWLQFVPPSSTRVFMHLLPTTAFHRLVLILVSKLPTSPKGLYFASHLSLRYHCVSQHGEGDKNSTSKHDPLEICCFRTKQVRLTQSHAWICVPGQWRESGQMGKGEICAFLCLRVLFPVHYAEIVPYCFLTIFSLD